MLRRLARQLDYHYRIDRQASRLTKLMLGLRFNCYVSPRASIYEAHRVQLADRVEVHREVVLNYHPIGRGPSPNIVIGEGTRIFPRAMLIPQQGWIRIGSRCTIQYGCLLYGVGGLEIGDDTRIAGHTIITPMNHVYADPDVPIRLQGETARGIRIGRDVWIGANVKIVDGVEIGDGCVVGAGSVVTRSLPPYSVAVGVPARVIKTRGAKDGVA